MNRSVGVDVLHRILTIYAVEVNVKRGIACKRIPRGVENVDLMVLLRSAVLGFG